VSASQRQRRERNSPRGEELLTAHWIDGFLSDTHCHNNNNNNRDSMRRK